MHIEACHDTAPRDRVCAALRFERPDRTPRDFAAVPDVWQRLGSHFGTPDRHEVLNQLGVNCRVVSYDSYCYPPDVQAAFVDMDNSEERSSTAGMWRSVAPDGSTRDVWGAHRRSVATPFGLLEELASYPLADVQTVDELRNYRWPEPEWWDFSKLVADIEMLNRGRAHSIRYRVGSVFETAWSLYGMEKFLIQLLTEPDLPMYTMERIAEVHYANLYTALEVAGGQIDIVYFYDDLASQTGLLISPKLYERRIMPFHKRLVEIAAGYGKPVMMHSCGAVYPLIPRLLDMGIRILNPIQPRAAGMDSERLAAQFGGRLVFHGGIDVQQFLPHASPEQVRERVADISETLGSRGGYICAGSHHIQADTPLENVLAMYDVEY